MGFSPFGLFGRRRQVPEEPAPASEDPRRPVMRRAGCGTWARTPLVFMSNGGNYCAACARGVRDLFRYRPAGRRDGDVVDLDGADAEPAPRGDRPESPAA